MTHIKTILKYTGSERSEHSILQYSSYLFLALSVILVIIVSLCRKSNRMQHNGKLGKKQHFCFPFWKKNKKNISAQKYFLSSYKINAKGENHHEKFLILRNVLLPLISYGNLKIALVHSDSVCWGLKTIRRMYITLWSWRNSIFSIFTKRKCFLKAKNLTWHKLCRILQHFFVLTCFAKG